MHHRFAREERTPCILLVDDDPEDRALIRKSLADSHLLNRLYEVADGEEMMEYLLQRGRYAPPAEAPRPSLILLDLNMPRKDGREALLELKQHASLRSIPVIVLTVSDEAADILRSYDLGVSAFVVKPPTLPDLQRVVEGLAGFWIQVVRLP